MPVFLRVTKKLTFFRARHTINAANQVYTVSLDRTRCLTVTNSLTYQIVGVPSIMVICQQNQRARINNDRHKTKQNTDLRPFDRYGCCSACWQVDLTTCLVERRLKIVTSIFEYKSVEMYIVYSYWSLARRTPFVARSESVQFVLVTS